MLARAKLVCFAATTNAPAARDFYANTLGLRLVDDSPHALVFDANGTMLRVQKTQGFTPAPHTALGWDVPDIRAEVRELAERGIRFNRYDGLPQDDQGIWTTPDGAMVAWFKDPEGNTLSLTQFWASHA